LTTQVQDRPFLTVPWQAGITGWIVVFGAVVVELVGGVIVNAMSMAVAAPVFIAPVAIAVGFGVAQWLQMRSVRDEPASWWHFAGIAAGLFTWQAWPVTPSQLQPIANAHDACVMMFTATPACIARATTAMDNSHIIWWVTGGVIVALALLVRRSKIAAWAAVPVALAGCQLAAHVLELLLLHYHVPGA
jgi:uncharacterized membrane protein